MEYGDGWDSPFGGQLGGVQYILDKSVGHSDSRSLKIESEQPCTARWAYTALGEPFFQKPFSEGKRYRLIAYLKTKRVQGKGATIGIRLHRENRENRESVFDWKEYEHYYGNRLTGSNDWKQLEVITPPIHPKPNRVHLLLEQSGQGESWFDDVEFEEVD